ncbi:MAG: iron-containing alcohol dehydrogenase [Minwuia sp.]|uniref:iron-containing alcohol dehydrogenase n=1 Tax=Minwuia sp. TaxID=2493630 RepID=UPI003A84A46E
MQAYAHEFLPQDRVIWGRPAADAVADEMERRGARRVFVVSSRTLNRKTDVIGRIEAKLGDRLAGVFDEIAEHTPRTSVMAALAAVRAAEPDLIVSVGGGTPIDAVKVLLVCLAMNVREIGDMDACHMRVLEDGSRFVPDVPPPPIPHIAVPTTLSAAEFSNLGGCTDTERKIKHGYTARGINPATVILDPEATLHTPDWLWLSTGIRGVDHAAEGICAVEPSPMVDGCSLQALRLFSEALPATKRNPSDLEARLACQQAAWLSGSGILRVQYGASHGIGHSLGAVTGMSHGHTSCVMLAPVLRYNRSHTEARQQWIAEAMGRSDGDASAAVAGLVTSLDQPSSLSSMDVKRDQVDDIVAGAMQNLWVRTNPRPIDRPEQVREILEMAW